MGKTTNAGEKQARGTVACATACALSRNGTHILRNAARPACRRTASAPLVVCTCKSCQPLAFVRAVHDELQGINSDPKLFQADFVTLRDASLYSIVNYAVHLRLDRSFLKTQTIDTRVR